MNHFGIVAAQEKDDTRDLLGLRPLRKVGVRHCFAVRLCVDDAGLGVRRNVLLRFCRTWETVGTSWVAG